VDGEHPVIGVVRAISFDLGGTLVQVEGEATTATLGNLIGLELSQARVLVGDLAKRRRCSPAQLAGELVSRFSSADFDLLLQALERARHRAQTPALHLDARPALAWARRRGLMTMALSNSLGCTIPEDPIAALGSMVDHVFYSADIGATKPDPAAFRHLEHIAGLQPGQLLHVGDSVRADTAGALACGWNSAWLDRSQNHRGRCPPDAAYLTSLTDLPALFADDGGR
jgi:FMN phosphatase YigB (HAD superfamily)